MPQLTGEIQRVNIKISKEMHDFYSSRSRQTGISMSALMAMALEEHRRQIEAMRQLPDLMAELEKVKDLADHWKEQ